MSEDTKVGITIVGIVIWAIIMTASVCINRIEIAGKLDRPGKGCLIMAVQPTKHAVISGDVDVDARALYLVCQATSTPAK